MKRLRIRHKLLATLLALTLFSLLTFYLLIIGSAEQILRDNATRQVRQLAAKSTQELQSLTETSSQTLLAAAASPDLHHFLRALESRDLRRMESAISRLELTLLDFQKLDKSLQAIRFVDTDGNVMVKVREGEILPRKPAPSVSVLGAVHSLKGREFFTGAMSLPRGGVAVSNMERGRVEEEEKWCPALVRFSTPVFFENGRRAGLVIINVWAETAGSMINRLLSAEEGSAFLVERNPANPERHGIYLFHQNEACEFGNQTGTEIKAFRDFPPVITSSWMKDQEGVGIDPRTGDILAHRFYSPFGSDTRGWVVVVNARQSFFLSPLATIRARITLWGGVVVALAVGAALFFARSLTKPIHAVVEGTERIGRDLSQRIELDSRDELGNLAAGINQLAATLENNLEERQKVEEKIHHAEKLASIGEMAAGLAHELNTPLGNINALASLARNEVENGSCDRQAIARDLADISSQTARCSGIISGLLSFARRQEPSISCIDAVLLIKDAISLVGMKAKKKGVSLCFAEPAPFIVQGDVQQLLQVFVNLLLNAIDAVEAEKGIVMVETVRSEGAVRIRFIDNGTGIPAEQVGKIFDPFFTTKEVGVGTGLGLSVSYGIVTALGGEIGVQAAPEAGSIFTVTLPEGRRQ
jgi:two-component system NtrC family sensor kinase